MRSGASDNLNTIGNIATEILNTGSFSWKLNASIPAGENYTIEIISEAGDNYSARFTIIANDSITQDSTPSEGPVPGGPGAGTPTASSVPSSTDATRAAGTEPTVNIPVPTTTPHPTNRPDGKPGNGLNIGLGIGIGLGFPVLTAITLFCKYCVESGKFRVHLGRAFRRKTNPQNI